MQVLLLRSLLLLQVRGPASRLEAALSAFAEHVCASALALHACQEHFVRHLEVYTGDDAFDDDVAPGGDDNGPTSNARGTPEKFGLGEMNRRSIALSRALHAAALAQLPVQLHALVYVPAIGASADAAVDAGLPPRWQYTSVTKTYLFFYEQVWNTH